MQTKLQIKPILTSMRHHKAGVILIGVQVALTLAIVCNALFIIQQRLAHLSEPTGIDEPDTFVISNQWGTALSEQQTDANVQADLETLRRLPSVRDASPSNSYPLRGAGWDDYITLTPDQTEKTTDANVYLGDEHLLDTLGVQLVAGRNFNSNEIGHSSSRHLTASPVVIITKALADRLYPDGSALGKSLYEMSETPSTIIGIVDLLQNQNVSMGNSTHAYQSVLRPLRPDDPDGLYYIVRANPGQLATAMREAPAALFSQNRMRIFDPNDGELSFTEVRSRIYASDRGIAILMSMICIVLLAITAAGIIGLTSFWVSQRRRQIGVRRALGATRGDILSYFLTENILISLAGVVAGIVLAFGINYFMVTYFEMKRLSLVYVLIGVIVLLLLGQLATLSPARRASHVSPVEATRST
jgi:putative ABC transport system permease protein